MMYTSVPIFRPAKDARMRNALTRILILLVGTFQISCSHTPGSIEEKTGLTAINATLWVERSGEIEGEWHSDEILPYFGFIPGSIFGSPLEHIVLPVEVGEESRVVVQLSDWAAMAESAAEPMTDRNLELGLRIQPADTRFLRVSTLAYDLVHDTGMDGGFQELGRGGFMILVYTDRACDISGVITLGGDEYTHSISLPSNGFHYVHVGDNNHLSRQNVRKELLFVTNH